MSRYTFTSESVSEGHPDKVCDYISDSILDACLEQDKQSRVACETLCKSDTVVLAGEITTTASLDFDRIVRQAVKEIGYTDTSEPFCDTTLKLVPIITKQSSQISQGVTATTSQSGDQGAGDQGIMFGYATDESQELMPLPILLAHKLMRVMADDRKSGKYSWLRPDSKSQVSLSYDGNTPRDVTAVVIYGGAGRHGGGAFSGKDPSKVDRSSAYFCRFVAKQVVASGLAKKAEIQVGYAIGMAKPVSVKVDTFGTGDERAAEEFVMNAFDFRPRAIVDRLDLLRPIYRSTTNYGHFGRPGLPWETVEKSAAVAR
jgi:S-adenosylmethionine synthetase